MNLYLIFGVTVALVSTLTFYAVIPYHSFRAGMIALGLLIAYLGAQGLSMLQLIGTPKPAQLEFLANTVEEADVIASLEREGQGIYLYLMVPGKMEPLSYVLPWDKKMAQQLQDAKREAKLGKGRVKMRQPFEPTLDMLEPKFYNLPQPAPVPKDAQEQEPEIMDGWDN